VRKPEPFETRILIDLLQAERAALDQQPRLAAALVERYRAAGHADKETAAWVALARAVMNLDEFLSRE
jgi:hypothetical protein